ncbi:MAG TPA: hypothetical protein VFY92_07400 [Hyphomicrobiaceae bacterium]|nr:hypothetical protein [Hyphomicrobiaceae bacterium]
MKTQEVLATLRAFADLADGERADELRKLASAFDSGKNEAVAARVSRILKNWAPQQPHPPKLKESLVAIACGLMAAGAKKQAADIQAVLALFDGAGIASADGFIERIAVALTPPAPKTGRAGKAKQLPDVALASALVEALAKAVSDPDAYSKVIARLHDTKLVPTPTLGLVANRFLGNSKRYSGRKAAIDEIEKRHKLDSLSHARGKALDRIAV